MYCIHHFQSKVLLQGYEVLQSYYSKEEYHDRQIVCVYRETCGAINRSFISM